MKNENDGTWEIMEIYEIYRNVRSGGSLHSPRNLEIVLLE